MHIFIFSNFEHKNLKIIITQHPFGVQSSVISHFKGKDGLILMKVKLEPFWVWFGCYWPKKSQKKIEIPKNCILKSSKNFLGSSVPTQQSK